MIRGDFRKVMNDDQKKWIVKTLFHEIGHYVSLGLLPNREIMLNYIDFVYPKKSRMMASDIPRIISYLSDTNWEEYFNETVRKKKIKYFDFYGFEPYFPPSENYKIVNGDREHSNLVGMGKVTRNFRYRRDGDNFISEYAKTNTREDFAEHFAEYIIDPENLKKRAPVKYEYFEKLFSGNEFRPVQGDQKIFSESHSILQKCEFPVE